MNNEEKRETIEDLIGLSFFDEKKAESEKQLTAADQRLEVAMATMSEVKKQIDELEIERNMKLRYELVGRELQRFKAIDAASKLKLLLSEKSTKKEIFESNSTRSTELKNTKSTLKEEIDKIEDEKSAFSKKLHDYNQAKSTIDSDLSREQGKYNQAEIQIKTSNNRVHQIEKRLPEITGELEKMDENQGVVDLELEDVKKSIEIIKEQKRSINKKIHGIDSQLAAVLTHQSELAAKKGEFDDKIRSLKNKLHDALVSKS